MELEAELIKAKTHCAAGQSGAFCVWGRIVLTGHGIEAGLSDWVEVRGEDGVLGRGEPSAVFSGDLG